MRNKFDFIMMYFCSFCYVRGLFRRRIRILNINRTISIFPEMKKKKLVEKPVRAFCTKVEIKCYGRLSFLRLYDVITEPIMESVSPVPSETEVPK